MFKTLSEVYINNVKCAVGLFVENHIRDNETSSVHKENATVSLIG